MLDVKEHILPNDIKELFAWKNDKKRFPESVEKYEDNLCYTQLIKNCEIDTLYSFLSIYALGVWAYNKDSFELKSNKIYLKQEIKKKCKPNVKSQQLWSKNFLTEIHTENNVYGITVDELNVEMKNFVAVYFKKGNCVPLWSGGNCDKGSYRRPYMDIPELYFKKNEFWYTVLNSFEFSMLQEFISRIKEQRFNNLATFLDWLNPTTFKEYLRDCIKIIINRTSEIEQYIEKNNT